MPLVTYDEQRLFLDLPAGTDQTVIQDLLTETITLFEKEVGRTTAPFSAALTARTEIHQPSEGSRILTLDYPIASVTSIALGRDVNAPDETILPGDATTVVWQAGDRDLIRVDGSYWRGWYPRWVKVVYNTQDDQPADAKLAVKRMVATVYQGRGKEGFTSFTHGSRSWTIAEATEQDMVWQKAVNAHRRGWFR